MRFASPVGTQAERDSGAVWPGGWFVATAYAQYYEALTNPAYHTGVDLNLGNYADSGAPVYAISDGEVVKVGSVAGWQGLMVCIRHPMVGDPDAPLGAVWSRYAHLKDLQIGIGQIVARGQLLGFICDYLPAGPANDHLHFDIARIDLGVKPGDWPGMDKARLLRDYYDPRAFILAHREETNPKVDEGKAREPYGRVVHVIPPDATEDQAVAIFRMAWQNDHQTVSGSYDDAGIGSGLQSKRAVLHGITPANRDSFRAFYQTWYPSTVVEFVDDVSLPPTPAPTITLTATPSAITAGQTSQLDWRVTNATGVTLNGEAIAPIGSRTVKPAKTTEYTVRAVGSSVVTKAVTVGVTPVQPPATGRATIRTGYHVLGDGTAATEIIDAGGQALCSIDNIDAARRMTAAGGAGVIRRWLGDGTPDPVGFAHGIEIYPHARVVGLCEKLTGTVREIEVHAQWDEAVARELRKRDSTVKYYGLTSAVGNPDFTNANGQDIVGALRKYYTPLYNSGLMGIDMHLYSPNLAHALMTSSIESPGPHVGLNVPETWWLEERFRFFFTLCDFDPAIQSIGCTEFLVDEGGIGGAPAHNMTPDQVVQLWKRTVQMWLCPTLIGGKAYPSPLEWATAFQGADREHGPGHWGGFYLGGYTPALRAAGCFAVATRTLSEGTL